MKSFFRSIATQVEKFLNVLRSPSTISKLESVADEIEQYAAPAIQAAQMIDALVPNKTTEEFIALAQKYQLHWDPNMTSDEKETLLQNAALQEIQKLVPNVPNNLLRTAICGVVNFLKVVAPTPVAVPATPPTT